MRLFLLWVVLKNDEVNVILTLKKATFLAPYEIFKFWGFFNMTKCFKIIFKLYMLVFEIRSLIFAHIQTAYARKY